MTLDEAFASKETIAVEIKRGLDATMNTYGYLILNSLARRPRGEAAAVAGGRSRGGGWARRGRGPDVPRKTSPRDPGLESARR